jgi:hypothetical protein
MLPRIYNRINKIVCFIFISKAYITSTSRAVVYMKSFPSNNILIDPVKKTKLDRVLADSKTDLTTYMLSLSNSIIKDKQILTTNGKEVLMLPEHKFLYEKLKDKYPERQLDSMYSSKRISNRIF